MKVTNNRRDNGKFRCLFNNYKRDYSIGTLHNSRNIPVY